MFRTGLFLYRRRVTGPFTRGSQPTLISVSLPPSGNQWTCFGITGSKYNSIGDESFRIATWWLLSCLTKLHHPFQGRFLVDGLTRLARIRPTCLALTARQSNRARDQRVSNILRASHVSIITAKINASKEQITVLTFFEMPVLSISNQSLVVALNSRSSKLHCRQHAAS